MASQELPCPISDDELREHATAMAAEVEAIAAAQERLAAARSDAKYEIDEARERLATLARVVASRTVLRKVETFDRPDYARRVVDTVRVDSGLCVATRPMTAADRQLTLDDANAAKVLAWPPDDVPAAAAAFKADAASVHASGPGDPRWRTSAPSGAPDAALPYADTGAVGDVGQEERAPTHERTRAPARARAPGRLRTAPASAEAESAADDGGPPDDHDDLAF